MTDVEDNTLSCGEPSMEVDEGSEARFVSISHSRALVSPDEHEFELITERLISLMDECRGEYIFEVGLGSGEQVFLVHFRFSFSIDNVVLMENAILFLH